MTQKLSVKQLTVNGKKVLIRVDFNVPMDSNSNITDDTRIKASLPTIKYVLNNDGSVILMSHLGRPKGKFDSALSLAPCAKQLSKLLNREVIMAPDCIGPNVEQLAKDLKPGQILMLENLRFHTAEEKPETDPSFATSLAGLGECYVNDAFGTAHRAHASVVDVPKRFPGKAAAGLLMEKEIRYLGEKLLNPKRPFCAILGGAKVSSKLGLIKALLKKVDALLIGGGMAYTFLKAQGFNIGNSIYEEELIPEARDILRTVQEKQLKFLLPNDIVAAEEFNNDSETRLAKVEKGVPHGFQGMDIGPETIENFKDALREASTVLWNGPLGVFEFPKFAQGTFAIARNLANLPATTIVAGGDSIAAITAANLADKFSHLSTGGGATLEYIEYGTLPGIEALTDAPPQPVKRKVKIAD